MLELVESRLPFGVEQWQTVASLYNSDLPAGWPQRDGDSLKRKFLGLKNKRKPTGDPDCPEEVRKAKRVFRMIEARCAVATLHDDDSESGEMTADVSPGGAAFAHGERGECEVALSEDLAAVNFVDNYDHDDTEMDVEDVDALVEQRVDAITLSSLPAQSSPPGQLSLRATARSGLSPSELASLSNSINKTTPKSNPPAPPVFLSQTAQRRIRLDAVLDSLASEPPTGNNDQGIIGMMMVMEHRQAARDADLRREREEREVAGEERECQLRLQLAEQQSAREAQNQQLMMMFMAKIFGPLAQPATLHPPSDESS